MPRGPTGLSLLLMAGLALAASLPSFAPWLSASDLQTAKTAVDLRPRCDSPEPLCPPPCPATNVTTKSTQCLHYLEKSHKEEVCGQDDLTPERRRNLLHGLRMRHCCEHAVDTALPRAAFQGGQPCRYHLTRLIELDQLVSDAACGIHDLLRHYDCEQSYSIVHTCQSCEDAYRRWVCSSLVPHYSSKGERVKPCLGLCHDVEQQCPYLLPQDWTNSTVLTQTGETISLGPTPQYAGEPTFLCLDPNIPEQRFNASSGDEDCCYTHCGSSGRGSGEAAATQRRTATQILGLCEHCPGRPAATSTSSAASFPRTINKVFLLWTAWTILFYSSFDFNQHNLTLFIINTLLKCLLVLCAFCVRTTLAAYHRTETYWKKSCS